MPAPLTIRAIESRVLTAENGPRYDQTAGLPSVRDAGARAPYRLQAVGDGEIVQARGAKQDPIGMLDLRSNLIPVARQSL